MPFNLTQKIIQAHLLEGKIIPGEEIGLKIDQTLTQDATGTLVMLELEAMRLERVKTELSAQYVDHNLIQADFKNPDDHLFLESAAKRFGIHFSRAGNGVSHPVHMEYFGKPGKTLAGSDSHTPAAGALGMLAIGCGGIDVASTMAGLPLYIKMPKIWGIKVTGKFPDWVSAKDAILELLKRHNVKGGVGYIMEYYGPGLKNLSAMDRHVIANMGAELGATTTIFPADAIVRKFLASQNRLQDWEALAADRGAAYDRHEELNLSALEPLIALPSSPGNVVPVSEVAGRDIYQAYIGSSANPGFRDYAICAEMLRGKRVAAGVSFDINPASRNVLEELVRCNYLAELIHAGARIHQTGCNGCIGMGQAPATHKNSLRTVPRNFPGRSGTDDDQVFLCSPETATASALHGKITDPRTMGMPYPKIKWPRKTVINDSMIELPLPIEQAKQVPLIKGPNIVSLPQLEKLPESLTLPILLKVGDNISTDTILPAGEKVLPYRSNIPKISEFTFHALDSTYVERARKQDGGHIIIGGENYGQGSSREHAALSPRYLGLRVVIAKSFARIHWQNLINFGILPFTFVNPSDYDLLAQGDLLILSDLHQLLDQPKLTISVKDKNKTIALENNLSERQKEIVKQGGLINWIKTG
jgi:predicted aconitate hydratase